MVGWLRENVVAIWVLLVLRLWLGWTWFMAGLAKIQEPAWTGQMAGTTLANFANGAISQSAGTSPNVQDWYAGFLTHIVIPNANQFAYLVAWGEVFVGAALMFGCFTTFAAATGAFLNIAYLLAGSSSINPQMLMVSILIVLAGFNAGKFGFDYCVVPWLRTEHRFPFFEKAATRR